MLLVAECSDENAALMRRLGFMTSSSSSEFRGLKEAIEELAELSVLFVANVRRDNKERATKNSIRAMMCFDYIVGEIMRERDNKRGAGSFDGSALERLMRPDFAWFVSASVADQRAMCLAGPGEGRLPPNLGIPKPISLEKTLNKVKHRNPKLVNFRFEGDRHIFLVCPNGLNGRAESIVEFDVEEFCSRCTAVADAI